jgi:cobalamin biosynthesis protein CobT
MNELKKELSKLSGVDMFNPKFRDVFKKYFPEDKDAEEEALKEKGIETDEVEENTVAEEIAEETAEETTEEVVEDKDAEEVAEDVAEADTVEEAGEVVEDAVAEEVAEETTEEKVEEVTEAAVDNTATELLDARIENELLKGGVRPEKLNAAKRVMKVEVNSLEDLGKVQEILREYPEWVRGYDNKGYGMSVDEAGDSFTAEERRLMEMGIDPRN